MSSHEQPLPQWTWGDLEAALNGFSPMGADDPVWAHLMRGLMDDAESLSPRDLLTQILSAGWVMAQVGAQRTAPLLASVTVLRGGAGVSAS